MSRTSGGRNLGLAESTIIRGAIEEGLEEFLSHVPVPHCASGCFKSFERNSVQTMRASRWRCRTTCENTPNWGN